MRISGVLYIALDRNRSSWLAKILLSAGVKVVGTPVLAPLARRSSIKLHGRMRPRMRRAVWFPV